MTPEDRERIVNAPHKPFDNLDTWCWFIIGAAFAIYFLIPDGLIVKFK